ncbi:MAG: SPOR domain-containing protein [Gammaproteobacteria bacterium]
MDRKLKERITGATLLVLAAVIFIPWLLDGRVAPNELEKSIVIPPPGGGASNLRTIVLDADRDASAPVTAAPVPTRTVRETPAPAQPVAVVPVDPVPETVPESEPATTTVVASAVQAPREEPPPPQPAQVAPPVTVATAPAPARTVKPDPATGWAVQVGSFASQANANKLADQLNDLEYKSFVSRKRLNGRVMYRVRVGPRATREEALGLAERLKIDRQPVRVVEHPG